MVPVEVVPVEVVPVEVVPVEVVPVEAAEVPLAAAGAVAGASGVAPAAGASVPSRLSARATTTVKAAAIRCRAVRAAPPGDDMAVTVSDGGRGGTRTACPASRLDRPTVSAETGGRPRPPRRRAASGVTAGVGRAPLAASASRCGARRARARARGRPPRRTTMVRVRRPRRRRCIAALRRPAISAAAGCGSGCRPGRARRSRGCRRAARPVLGRRRLRAFAPARRWRRGRWWSA